MYRDLWENLCFTGNDTKEMGCKSVFLCFACCFVLWLGCLFAVSFPGLFAFRCLLFFFYVYACQGLAARVVWCDGVVFILLFIVCYAVWFPFLLLASALCYTYGVLVCGVVYSTRLPLSPPSFSPSPSTLPAASHMQILGTHTRAYTYHIHSVK